MKYILKLKWIVLAVWLAAAAGLFLSAPNMADLVRDKGQITVPEGYSSSYASELLSQMNAESDARESTAVLVFHDDQGFSEDKLSEINRGIDTLQNEGDRYGITSVITHFNMPELEEQMVSKDGKTILAMVTVHSENRTASEMSEALYEPLADLNVEHYYTGDWIISEDVIKSSEEGLRRTEVITVIFILAILFIVFRSAVAPFIPLLSVGISYVAAQSIVAFLAEYASFPLSNFTQIFMVAVMFGIGTDYCILLISRFKEELSKTGDTQAAVLNTYKTAGKTVLVAGLAVLVGFISIGFSKFVLYQSAVAVAVGVAVLLLALITLVPFFMGTLGKKMFWPAKGSLEHKKSRLWEKLGSFSLKRPLWAILFLAVIIVPFIAAYQGTTSFNSLDEIGNRYKSVKGFEAIAASFGPGESLPSTVVVQTDKPLDTMDGLAAAEQVSSEISKVEGVKLVRSVTRPAGEPLKEFQVTDQVGTLGSGLEEGVNGLNQIEDGLAEASQALNENAPMLNEAAAGADQLISGTNELKQGVLQLGSGIRDIEQGLRSGSAGASELENGLKEAEASAKQLAQAASQLLQSYQELGTGLVELQDGYEQVEQSMISMTEQLTGLNSGLAVLAQKYPALNNDAVFTDLQAGAAQIEQYATGISQGLTELNKQLTVISSGLDQANAGLAQTSAGQIGLSEGLTQLAAGLSNLREGIDQAAAGQGQIAGQIPSIEQGFDNLIEGQEEIKTGFATLNGQIGQLTGGLDESVDGLKQISEGLTQAKQYLDELSGTTGETGGWFIPEEAIESEEFQAALDMYMSPDRMTAKFEVVFADNPYEAETMDKIDDLETAVQRALRNTAYADAEFAVGGVTSMNNDLRDISNEDYKRTVVLMMIGIAIILILLFRSIVMPIYIILSLVVTYFTSMAISEVIFVDILGYSGLTWAVPFFGFVMLIALGVDYSIFLMDRFKEYRHLPPKEGILEAMRNMGTVIISAAVILGGTFAAMLPSGVMSLLQIASIVICGLFLYALLMLPLFIPVMVRLFGEANWWPMMKRSKSE